MKRIWTIPVAFLFILGGISLAFAGATKEEAKSMVEKAVSYYKANGKEKALKEFNNPKGEFAKKDLYIFVYDKDFTVIAHPINPNLVGVNTLDMPDVDGKYFRKDAKEMLKKADTAWVDYIFKNPQTGKVEMKTTYMQKAGDMILCCGAYK